MFTDLAGTAWDAVVDAALDAALDVLDAAALVELAADEDSVLDFVPDPQAASDAVRTMASGTAKRAARGKLAVGRGVTSYLTHEKGRNWLSIACVASSRIRSPTT